jgi:hypothetical protein
MFTTFFNKYRYRNKVKQTRNYYASKLTHLSYIYQFIGGIKSCLSNHKILYKKSGKTFSSLFCHFLKWKVEISDKQGCGSGLIQAGSGSRNLAQSGYGSGSTMSLNPDPIRIRVRIHNSTLEYKFFQRLKKQQKKSKILAVFPIFIPFRYKNK